MHGSMCNCRVFVVVVVVVVVVVLFVYLFSLMYYVLPLAWTQTLLPLPPPSLLNWLLYDCYQSLVFGTTCLTTSSSRGCLSSPSPPVLNLVIFSHSVLSFFHLTITFSLILFTYFTFIFISLSFLHYRWEPSNIIIHIPVTSYYHLLHPAFEQCTSNRIHLCGSLFFHKGT